jgi:ERCC4-type nuclease
VAADVTKIPLNTFVIDTRENPKRQRGVRMMSKKLKLNTITEALTTSDYCSKYCAIELKAGSDLISSILKGNRLSNQMERLKLMPQPIKVLLVTGRLINPKYSKVSMESVIGQLCSLACQGICVIRVQKKEEVSYICRMMKKGFKYGPELLKEDD